MAIKLLTYDVYRSGMLLFKQLADVTYQDRAHLPEYYLRKAAKSETPPGYDTAYHLLMHIPGEETDTPMGELIGIIGAEGGGVIQGYIVPTSVEYSSSWLTDVPGGEPFIPSVYFLYLVLTPGNEYNSLYRFNGSTNRYEEVIDGTGAGALFCYTVTGKTPLNPDWLTDTSGGSPIDPKEGILYLVLTPGDYYNNFFRYDKSSNKYIVVNDSEIIFAYEVSGKTALNADWLSTTPSGPPLTPVVGKIYYDLTPGVNENRSFRFNASTNKYVNTGGSGGGAIFAYIVGSTKFSSTWLSKSAGGAALTPEVGMLYLVLSSGEYYSNVFRWDGSKYVVVVNARVRELTQAQYLALSSAEQNDGTIFFITDTAETVVSNDDYLPSLVNSPATPQTGAVILWRGATGSDFSVSPAVYKYDGTEWIRQDLGTERIQYAEMPTPAEEWAGKIVEFVGTSTAEFTKGYFYECLGGPLTYNLPDFYPPLPDKEGDAQWWSEPYSYEVDLNIDLYLYQPHIYIDGVEVAGWGTGDNEEHWIGLLPAGAVLQFNGASGSYVRDAVLTGNNYHWEQKNVQPGGTSGGLPDGGTTGQALVKKSNTDQDVEWQTVSGLPDGGTTGQALVKVSDTDQDVTWSDVSGGSSLPDGGTTGQVLAKHSDTDQDVEWVTVQTDQVTSMPIASADYEGKIFQFVGEPLVSASRRLGDANPTYKKGYFYECVQVSGVYSWKELQVSEGGSTIQVDTIPTASADLVGTLYQYIGSDTADYKHGFWYECKEPTTGNYAWVNVKVQTDPEPTQYTTMPAPSAALNGKVYQYIGADGGGFIKGYFYECVESSTPGTYQWVSKDVQLGGHQIKSGSTSLLARPVMNFTDLDVSDDSTNAETDVKTHLLSSNEFDEIFDSLPKAHTGFMVYDQRGTEHVVGVFIDLNGVSHDVYERWFELEVPSAAVTELTDLMVSVEANVEHYVDVRGGVVVDGWQTNLVWGGPSFGANGVMLAAYDNTDTSGNANKVGVFYNGDITSFQRIYVIARYVKSVTP